MATEIKELKSGQINVTVEGMVRRNSTLNGGVKGKYFHFYLVKNEDSHQIRRIQGASDKVV